MGGRRYCCPMLVVDGLSKSYGAISALDDVSVSVEAGEVLALVGENGAGKSTLVRCMARAETQDSGSVRVDGQEVGRTPRSAIEQGISVVWQDLALCENLDVAANLFLGREIASGLGLQRSAMHSAALSVFADLGVEVPDLSRPIHALSGGQRQLVAIARATLEQPKVLILDEPTAALGVTESATVRDVIRALQARGVAIILVSHQIDEVFSLANRIMVMRHGRRAALLNRSESHPDDVVALIAGVEADTTASQQITRLHSLSEQLADADASSVLPLTVSSLSDAMSCDRLAVFLAEGESGCEEFRLTAALNLSAELEGRLRSPEMARGLGFVDDAAVQEKIMLLRDLHSIPDEDVARSAAESGVVGAWAAPIVGQAGTLAVIVGFTDLPASLQTEQKQLLELFSTMAGAAIDRGELVESLRINVQSLEGLQGVLEVFASVEDPAESLGAALDALRDGIGARTTTLVLTKDDDTDTLTNADSLTRRGDELPSAAASFEWTRGRGELIAELEDASQVAAAEPLLQGAANSFRIALERGVVREARQESTTLRVGRELERNLTKRLGHELRTPLTAIQGFASTLMQSDVEWADADRRRFTELIAVESERLSRLVDALFDSASLEAGTFLANSDYCNVTVAAERARQLAGQEQVTIELPADMIAWADGDRLEQMFINLFSNAVRHNPPGTQILVEAIADTGPRVGFSVFDTGTGLPVDVLDYFNGRLDDLGADRGLGVRLIRGFAVAQQGAISASAGPEGSVVSIWLPAEPGLKGQGEL